MLDIREVGKSEAGRDAPKPGWDGSDYGAAAVSPNTAAIRTKAFQALRALGFREGESKRAIERAAGHVGSVNTKDLLRRALRELDRCA